MDQEITTILEDVFSIAKKLGLAASRDALLANVPVDIREEIKRSNVPTDQIRIDIFALGERHDRKRHPYVIRWIQAAAALRSENEEAKKLEKLAQQIVELVESESGKTERATPPVEPPADYDDRTPDTAQDPGDNDPRPAAPGDGTRTLEQDMSELVGARFWDCLIRYKKDAEFESRRKILEEAFVHVLNADSDIGAPPVPARLDEGFRAELGHAEADGPGLTRFQGKRGLGASTVLFSINALMHADRLDDPAKPLPIYVNIRRFQLARRDGSAAQAVSRAVEDVCLIWDRVPETGACGVVLLLEGLGLPDAFVEEFCNQAFEHAKSSKTRLVHVIASATHTGFAQLTSIVGAHFPSREDDHDTFLLKEMPVITDQKEEHSTDLRGFVEKQLQLDCVLKAKPLHPEPAQEVDQLLERIGNFNLHYITMPLLELMRRYHDEPEFESADTFARFFRAICQKHVRECLIGSGNSRPKKADIEARLPELRKAAMQDFYNEVTENIERLDLSGDITHAQSVLIDGSSITRDFLVAEHILDVLPMLPELLKQRGVKNFAEMIRGNLGWPIEFDFPISVNFFTHVIVKENLTQRTAAKLSAALCVAIEQAEVFVEQELYRALNQVVYLFGRLAEDLRRVNDPRMLREYVARIDEWIIAAEAEGRPDDLIRLRVIRRTAFVSLIFMNDEEALETYINMILSDPTEASINRAFHLIYYGDKLPYSTSRHSQDLRSCYLDDYRDGWPTSYRSSLNSLLGGLLRDRDRLADGKSPRQDYQLRLATICSFVRHGHTRGSDLSGLHDYAQTGSYVLSFLQVALEQDFHAGEDDASRLLPRLRAEIEAVLRASRRHADGLMQGILDLYGLKYQLRQGWLKRGLPDPGDAPRVESVAEHVLFTLKLAAVLLPKKCAELPNYSRRCVMDLLLFHDDGEALIGDYVAGISKERRAWEERNEREAARYFDLRRPNAARSAHLPVTETILAFQEQTDVNARIAGSMDRLENLIQLEIYYRQGLMKEGDYGAFREDLITRIGDDDPIRIKLRNFAQEFLEWAERNAGKFDLPAGYGFTDDALVADDRPP